jgi:hypothetical protein
VVLEAGAVVAVVGAVVSVEPVVPVPPVAPVEPVLPVGPVPPVEPVGPVGMVCVGVCDGVLEDESPGLMTTMISAVTSTTPAAPPIAFTSSPLGRPGFQLVLVCRWAGFRRFVTSS